MFKVDWEKTSTIYSLPQGIIEEMVQLAFPNETLISHELIAGGCANLNIKFILKNKETPFILRIYLREKEAAYREQKLAVLLKPSIPIPLIYSIGEIKGLQFAIAEFMPGISLRDFLLRSAPFEIKSIMFEVGMILSKITTHEFSQAGFFNKDLNIIPHTETDNYLTFVKECLKHENILSTLTPETISKIIHLLNKYSHLFPSMKEKHLVHADFDPANIFINKTNNAWKVSAVLDWEFAFSGSGLTDVANMLRYAHKISPEFQNAFLDGLTNGGIILPNNWRTTINLLNLESLLDCLKRTDLQHSPNRCADIRKLIDFILLEISSSNEHV